jgi:hypothetical protein
MSRRGADIGVRGGLPGFAAVAGVTAGGGSVGTRRPVVTVLVLLCVLACGLVIGVGVAGAVTQFGDYGEAAGQFREPWGVAVDQASGDVYVADIKNKRIDEFEASGNFVRAWGWGVLNEAKELQSCTVATGCGQGIEGSGPGELSESHMGVAVDNDPLSSSYGDVYVDDSGGGGRVEKYGPSGEFLLEFAAEDPNGVIAVDPAGRVYVGGKASVQVFEPSGVLSEDISLTTLSSTGRVTALAVDGSGDVFVKDEGVPGVREFEADGTEMATRFDVGSETAQDLTVDGSGDLFVGEASVLDSPGTFRVLEYSPSGVELASFDNESVVGIRDGIAFASVLGVGELYVTDDLYTESLNGASGAVVNVVPVPVSGPPVIVSGSVSATGGRRGHAMVKATLEAEGNPTTYHVEYVSEAAFLASGYADASSTPEVSLGKKFAEVPVSVELSGLEPGGLYHYRVVASNAEGLESSPDQTVEAVPPALIDGPWVADVSSTSATFAAEIDPLGLSTEYRIEYGLTSAYGETLTGNVGEGEGYVPVSVRRQDLTPDTVYHYRVVVHNEVGVYAGPDHSFMTQATGGQELSLPDGRAWELVSPADKKGALIGALQSKEPFQAAADGSAIAYPASEPVGEGAVGRNGEAMILSRRGVDGWSSQDISTPNSLPGPEESQARSTHRGGGDVKVFSADLSLGLYEPDVGTPPLSAEATGRTLYLRDDANGTYLPLETPGTRFGYESIELLGGAPDLSHVIFDTSVALTPEAVAGSPEEEFPQNLYEWSGGKLQLVNITPSGTSKPGAYLGDNGSRAGGGMTTRAISSNGRWVVWANRPFFGLKGTKGSFSLYVRDMVAGKTFKLGGEYPRFETMSSDGSKVFFVETDERRGGDLYVFDTATGTETDLTADHGSGEPNAGVQDAVMGASEDGSYVYFVATGVLANGAVKGADNVYVLHDSEGNWTTTYIATLAGEDEKSWRGSGNPHESSLAEESGSGVSFRYVSSRVSPNGQFLAFMSERPLTGYDNLDAVSGQPDEEVYLYDAVSNRLVCASCDPTGARPVGVFDDRTFGGALLADLDTAWSANEGSGNHWLAGSIPGWVINGVGLSFYQPRYLSDSGRLFFDSPDALVPQDTNGLEDAYEYEPAGVGSCTTASTTYSERSQGCVSLISSGQSSGESIFMDASENGNDVFFATNSKLTGEDYDTAYDIYDAHVCSSELPCRSETVVPPPCTSGDSCKAAPSPQPEIFGPAPSATFSGVGNIVEEAKTSVVKRKGKAKSKPKLRKHAKRKKRKAKRARKARAGSGRSGGKGR